MFDVFYLGTTAPGLFVHERAADSVEHARGLSRTRYLWIVNCDSNYSTHDWLWEPPPWQSQQCHAWASQWQKDSDTYLVPRWGYEHINYHPSPMIPRRPTNQFWHIPNGVDAQDFDCSWHPDVTEPNYIYQFGTQHQRTGGPRYVMPGATEVKYITTPRATKTTRDPHWIVPDGADTETFDWTWHPDDRDPAYIYQFGTQHQRTGGPRYVMPGATEIKYVDQIRIKTHSVATAIIEIDHLDGHAGKIPNTTRTARYFDNYLDTLRRIAKNSSQDHEFVWICSSVCDYTDFDFSWHPEQWQTTMLHVFASDGEKFGDTFFMHVPTFQYRSDRCELLEWYDVNFIDTVSVPRRPMPVIQHNSDSHVSEIQTNTWAGPLAVFSTVACDSRGLPAVPLWREKNKTVTPLDASGSRVIIPRVAVPHIRTQVYDYAWIDKTHRDLLPHRHQDIVFISFDEPQADINWTKLHNRFSRAYRVHGVAGMENALVAAARHSSTPWYFAVFAKTELEEKFDFSFAPDYLQQPKHYVFDCHNTVNDLVYGHMGVVLYNCHFVLQQHDYVDLDLDYTLSFPHEVVPQLSCWGTFDSTPYHTWRTAFRECAKLALYQSRESTVETQHRLDVWQTRSQGPYAKWCLVGAREGVEFFRETQGDLSMIKQSFDWQWLRQRFTMRHGDVD